MTALPTPVSWLAETSLRVSLAIVLLMLMRPWLRKWIGNGTAPWLWLILAIRLLLPWPMPLPSSLLPTFTANAARPAFAGPVVRFTIGSTEAKPPGASLNPPRIAQRSAAASFWWSNRWNLLWLAGVVISLANLLRAWSQTRRWAGLTAPGDNDARLREAFASIPTALRRGVTVRVTRALDVPTLFGLWHPQIWMPQACLDRLEAPEIRHILLHEIGHARRRDLLAQWIWSLACSLHWFNPLVWFAARLARADRELACDAWVLAREGSNAGNDFAADYGRTLIRVAAHLRPSRAPSPAAVAMATGKHNLGLRVREIGRFRPVAPGWGLAATAVTLAGVTLLTAGHTAPVPAPSPEPSPALSASPSPAPVGASQPPPAAGARPSRRQLEFEGKMVALSRTAVAELKEQKAQFPGAEGLIDQLTGAFAQKDAAGAPAAMPFSVCEVVSAEVSQKFLQRLLQMKGADLVSAPRVTTKPDQKATIEIIREFIYPTKFERSNFTGVEPILTPQKFEKKNTGLTLEVEAGLSPAEDAVDFNVHWQLADVQGYVGVDGKPVPLKTAMSTASRPVFSTQEIETCVTMAPSSTLVLGSLRYNPVTWQALNAHQTIQEDAIVLLFVTVNLVYTDAHDASAAAREKNAVALRHKLEGIIIPAVEFHELKLQDAVGFLRKEGARLDPEPNPERRGVNILVELSASDLTGVRVTLSSRNVSMLEALRMLAAQIDMKLRVDEYAAALVSLN